MSFVGIVKQFVPPLIWRGLKATVGRTESAAHQDPQPALSELPVGFSGKYETFQAAKSVANAYNQYGYHHPDILAYYEAGSQPYVDSFKNGDDTSVDTKALRILGALAAKTNLITPGKPSLTVLDFGGALGSLYFRMRRFIPAEKVAWTVSEVEETAAYGQKKFSSDELQFVSGHPPAQTDLVIASSSVHYTQDPYETLSNLTDARPRFFVLDRQPLVDFEETFVAQRVPFSIYDTAHPYMLMNKNRIVEFMKKRGYGLLMNWSLDEEELVWNKNNIKYQGLLFGL